MRVVFLGSPEFALPTLRRLVGSEHEVVAVFTQPDRPVGRGRKMARPPVKDLALEHGLRVLQPSSISKPEPVQILRQLAPDVAVIAAYGQILKQRVLDIPRLGVLNVHASLLPRWRGAAPVPAAILAGDEETGATIMKVVLDLDAGPVLAQARIAIEPEDTTATLLPRVAECGATLLMAALPKWESGELVAMPQDEDYAIYAPQIQKADALIRPDRDGADVIARQVRAYYPWPISWIMAGDEPLRIVEAVPLPIAADREPGTVFALNGSRDSAVASPAGFAIATCDGTLGVVRVQSAGGKVMSAAAYMNGHRDIVGKRLTW